MNIEIKSYQTKNHQEVVRLVTGVQQKEFNLPMTYDDQPDLADIESFFDIFLVAFYQGKLVGTIGTKIIDNFAIIRKMFVEKEYRGSGFSIAQKLLFALESKIHSKNIKNIYLGTTEFFKAAHRFYERNNYIEISKSNLPRDFPVMKIDTRFYYKGLI